MSEASPETMSGVLTLLLIMANVFIYGFFNGCARIANALAGKELVAKRVAGSIGVVVFLFVAMWVSRTYLVNEQVLASMAPFEQGEYLGRTVTKPLFPALIVLAVVAFNGRRAKLAAAGKGK